MCDNYLQKPEPPYKLARYLSLKVGKEIQPHCSAFGCEPFGANSERHRFRRGTG
jgi:hypothetical protein